MALFPCPNCGKEVSDRAERCPACGATLKPPVEEKAVPQLCPECNEPLTDGMEFCPNCGCPIEKAETEQEPQKVEITKVNVPSSSKKKIITAILIVVIIAVLAAVIIVAEIKASKESAIATYQDNITSVSALMLVGAIDAETAGGLIHDVWYDAIFDEYNSDTRQYTKGAADFNEALENLFADSDFSEDMQSLQENKNSVNEQMKALTSPPEEMADAYEATKELYDSYLDIVNIVLSPTGSLQTYTSNFNDADSAFLNAYNAMEIYIE